MEMLVGNVQQPSSSFSISAPFRSVSAQIYDALPFTRKGSIVLVKGRPAIDTGFGEAALTAVKFRENILPSSVEAGRYFLLASYGDPWAQRTLIAHGLAGLKKGVGVILSDGWVAHFPLAITIHTASCFLNLAVGADVFRVVDGFVWRMD